MKLSDVPGLMVEENKGIIAIINEEGTEHFSQKDMFKAGENRAIRKQGEREVELDLEMTAEVLRKASDKAFRNIKNRDSAEFGDYYAKALNASLPKLLKVKKESP